MATGGEEEQNDNGGSDKTRAGGKLKRADTRGEGDLKKEKEKREMTADEVLTDMFKSPQHSCFFMAGALLALQGVPPPIHQLGGYH